MKWKLGILLLVISTNLNAQEVRLGLVGGTAPTKRIVLSNAQHSPANSYFTYVEENPGRGLIKATKAFNSVHLGAVINFSYKRFSFNIEPQYYYERTVYRFRQPYEEMDRVIGAKGFRMPFYFTYKFFKKENSAFFLLGWNVTKQNNWDFQHPSQDFYLGDAPAYNDIPDFGDNHFEGVLYDDQSYMSGMLGIGKQFKKVSASLRLQQPIGKVLERLPVRTWRVELTFNWLFLSSEDFTKKRPLYVD